MIRLTHVLFLQIQSYHPFPNLNLILNQDFSLSLSLKHAACVGWSVSLYIRGFIENLQCSNLLILFHETGAKGTTTTIIYHRTGHWSSRMFLLSYMLNHSGRIDDHQCFHPLLRNGPSEKLHTWVVVGTGHCGNN